MALKYSTSLTIACHTVIGRYMQIQMYTGTYFQCCKPGMFSPDPGSISNNKKVEKISCLTFFHTNENYFFLLQVKKTFVSIDKESNYFFNQKMVPKHSELKV
jgi:hypothetical protein